MLKLLLPIFFFSIFSFAQAPLLSIQNDLQTRNKAPYDAFAVVDDENNSFAIFLDDDKTLNGYLYSQDLKPMGKFASKGLPSIYTEIIGKTLKNGQIRLFLKNENNKNFGSVLFDFEREATIETEFGFKLNDEIYLQSISYKDKFYILTVTKKSSILNIYTFDHGGKFDKKSFDFNDEIFTDRTNKPSRLDKLITDFSRAYLRTEASIAKIDETNPNSISITSKACKIYDRGDKFILSIDESILYTYLFEFSVPDLSVKLTSVQKKQLPSEGKSTINNSYLFEDKIFHIAANSEKMLFTVKNIKSDEVLKQILLSKDEEITFKNSPIIQIGTVMAEGERRELDKTSQFLRKISDEDIGIAVSAVKGGYKITMGGNEKLNVNTHGALAAQNVIGAPSGNSGFSSGYFNPAFSAYSAYQYNKSTRIECLFDTDFNHVEGIIPQNVFDKIRVYTLRNPNGKAENVFRMNGYFIYGKYNSKEDVYQLFKFSE